MSASRIGLNSSSDVGLACCFCGERARAGVLVPGVGYLLRPCGHVSQVRES